MPDFFQLSLFSLFISFSEWFRSIQPNLVTFKSPSMFLCHSDKKSERAKDMHLLKRLTALLRSADPESGETHRMYSVCRNQREDGVIERSFSYHSDVVSFPITACHELCYSSPTALMCHWLEVFLYSFTHLLNVPLTHRLLFLSSLFALWWTDLLESEGQSVLLEIKHPAVKKQVRYTHIDAHGGLKYTTMQPEIQIRNDIWCSADFLPLSCL